MKLARARNQCLCQVAQDLVSSLTAARHASLLALSGVLQDVLQRSEISTPSMARSSINPFDTPETTSSFLDGADSDEVVLSSLTDSLRLQAERPSTSASRLMSSTALSSPLALSRSNSQIGPSPWQYKIDELQSCVAGVLGEMDETDAALAQALVSLLSCIERLLSISRLSPSNSPNVDTDGPSSARTTENGPDTDDPSSHNVYRRLEREARLLQENRREQWDREQAEAVVGAVREVEQAERELLWGRIDDLSEQVRALCRSKADALRAAAEEHESADASLYEPSITGSSDLPRYSHDGSINGHFSLPDYALDGDTKSMWDAETLSQSSPSRDDMSLKSSAPLIPRSAPNRTRRISNAHNEKMQRDLDSVSQAIERLYVVSPQLANQRVEPDRRHVREKQLVKLGNAIERLSKGRLEDQRAVPSPVLDVDDDEMRDRTRKRKDEALDRLIDQIDRAASRTLVDQRVDLK